MTLRQIGETGIKLMGVYFGALVVLALAGVAATFAVPPIEGMPPALELFRANLVSVLGPLLVAGVCLIGGEPIARELFSDAELAISGLTRRDLLVAGVALLGLTTALASIPAIIRIGAEALSYTEGTRQRLFWAAMEDSWQTLSDNGLALIVGAVTVRLAGRIAAALDPEFRGG